MISSDNNVLHPNPAFIHFFRPCYKGPPSSVRSKSVQEKEDALLAELDKEAAAAQELEDDPDFATPRSTGSTGSQGKKKIGRPRKESFEE